MDKTKIKIVKLNLSEFKQKYQAGFFNSMKLVEINSAKQASGH
jgi:hypothetical protein